MRDFIYIVSFIIFFTSCTYEKSGIADEMKSGLISFEQQTMGYPGSETDETNIENIIAGKILEKRADSILTITYFTEETACPIFEGGYKMIDNTLTLYYQDIRFQPVKCIDLFKLEYKITDTNLNYHKIEVVRLKPIKEGFHF